MTNTAQSWLLLDDDAVFKRSLTEKSFEDLRETLEGAITSLSGDEVPFDMLAQIVRRSRQILEECNSRIMATQDSLNALTNERKTQGVVVAEDNENDAF